ALTLRFDYGRIVPWVRRRDFGLQAIAGPDAVALRSQVPMRGEGFRTVAEFVLREGEAVSFILSWFPSHRLQQPSTNAPGVLRRTTEFWRRWSERCSYEGEWGEAVRRSLVTLKALTYSPTGGIVAAPTTSLPECPGGSRNWDYRYCWIRDATFTLLA